MTILHICAGWQKWNGAANIARLIMGEQERRGHTVSFCTWASICQLRSADEVWIHCGWLPCLWWAALWGRNVRWMPEACYDPVRLKYHGWKKRLAGPIERFFLRRAKALVATCEAEADWIRAYLGRRCPPIELADIKRFFNLTNLNPVNPVNPVKTDLHLLYLGRRHPLKGVEYLETAVRQIQEPSAPLRLSALTSLGSGASPRVAPTLKGRLRVRIISNAFGDELEKVWNWCDVLVLPTLSDNFGLVIAEALERGKSVITTDGAPAWSDGNDYGGRLIYLKGYRDGTPEERVRLLKTAIEGVCK